MHSEFELYLFHQGTNYFSHKMLGAHPTVHEGKEGIRFSLWAPNGKEVRVVGSFNDWQGDRTPMSRVGQSGVWSTFVPQAREGDLYKFEIITQSGERQLKSDPFAFYSEQRPKTASIVYPLEGFEWQDHQWQQGKTQSFEKPVLIYEVHLGSWKRKSNGDFLTYRELADQLVDYVAQMGYTHIEILPIAEHPFDGSWGYQITGYFSTTSRFGTPKDFMYFVDQCHQRGLGVILDWVPGHFCRDAHGLWNFDGTPQYEYNDPERANNRGWGTLNFDLGKPEVMSFLISNAIYWLEVFHLDGLRVDAVASILYLDYGKKKGEWISNKYGGRENLEGVEFLKRLNAAVFKYFPNTLMIAEESTTWPLVTMPIDKGGLGFNFKWNMGWMNDTLKYMTLDPIHKNHHHNKLTFSLTYAFSENFVLPLSHDEVVHGKKSLLDKMPGDYWQKFANLRGYYAYMMGHPGKKLLFMGGEFGQFIEWNHEKELDWSLLNFDMHAKLKRYVEDLNRFYRSEGAFWKQDQSWEGFRWVDPDNHEQSMLAFARLGSNCGEVIIVVINFTPIVYHQYRLGVPKQGKYIEALNSDHTKYGGSGLINHNEIMTGQMPWQNCNYSIELTIPPLGALFLKYQDGSGIRG